MSLLRMDEYEAVVVQRRPKVGMKPALADGAQDEVAPESLGENAEWDVREQPPELWDQFKTDFAPGTDSIVVVSG